MTWILALVGLLFARQWLVGKLTASPEPAAIVGNGALGDMGAFSADDARELGLDYIREAAKELAHTKGMEQYAPQYEAMAKQGASVLPGTDPVQIMMQVYSIVSPAPHTRAKVELWMAERGVTSRAGGSKATASDLELAQRKVKETALGVWDRVPTWGKAVGGLVLLLLVGGGVWFAVRRRRSSSAEPATVAA